MLRTRILSKPRIYSSLHGRMHSAPITRTERPVRSMSIDDRIRALRRELNPSFFGVVKTS